MLFVTYRRPNRWTKWAEIWHEGGNEPWDGLWVGVTYLAPSMSVAGKNPTKMVVCLIFCYLQVPNRWTKWAEIWNGAGMDNETVFGWV